MKRRRPIILEEDALVLSVSLLSGRFESCIHVPLNSSEEDRTAYIESWLHMMEQAVKVARSKETSQG